MRAFVLDHPGGSFALVVRPVPEPGLGEVLVQVSACALCRTDLHVLDGDLPGLGRPVIPGHQIVGTVVGLGAGADAALSGQRVGIPWLGWTCGTCRYCREGRENLCPNAEFTGYHRPGGLAEYVSADSRFVFPLSGAGSASETAPWLCAGLIGYRAWRFLGPAQRVGFYGFGAAAHILIQLAQFEGREVFAFTRPGDEAAQRMARRLGAVWAGGSGETAPAVLDGAILFAPVGSLLPLALGQIGAGGTVVCAGIHMTDIPAFPYRQLWGERVVRSVANLTRQDGLEFLALAPRIPIRTETTVYPLEEAARALAELREGKLTGSAVVTMNR